MKQTQNSVSWSVAGVAVALAVGVVLVLYALVGPTTPPTYAQDGDALGLEMSKTLDSEVVQIGEIIEFTIRIRNTGSLSITHIVVRDEFVDSIVAVPGDGEPHSDPLGKLQGNTIIWDDLFSEEAPLNPGETYEIKVYLRAVHPSEELQTVNRSYIDEAIRWDGEEGGGLEDEAEPIVVPGGSSTLLKELTNQGRVEVGTYLTYTITVENDGPIALETVPLRDVYNPSVLEFIQADPPHSSHNEATGTIVWDDLLEIVGMDELAPGESIEVTTIYRAVKDVEQTTNRAEVNGASDRLGNEIEREQADAPIRIVAPASPTAAATADATATPTAEATTTPTATIAATATPTAQITATQTTAPTATPTATSTSTPTRTPTPRPDNNNDDDDDDDDDDNNDQPTATMVIVQPTAAVAQTATPTATPTAMIVATTAPITTTAPVSATVPVPSTLPNTSGEIPAMSGALLALVLALVLVGSLLLWRYHRAA